MRFAPLFCLIAAALSGCASPIVGRAPDGQALVIAHRGASAYVPEHTLAAYELAIALGADFVEPDLVSTKDGALVARHENEISGTTNVAEKTQFADRKTTKMVDGVPVTGWFTEDFTLAELKTLRARERIPANRPDNTKFNDQFEIPTLDEIIKLVQSQEKQTGRRIGIYPETKHPTYFQGIGLPLEARLVKTLHDAGYHGKNAPILIQSFEVANLKALRQMTDLPLVQLLNNPNNAPASNGTPQNKPYDFIVAGDSRNYGDLATAKGLQAIAQYADAVGPYKEIIIPRTADNHMGQATHFVKDAHAAGLGVHIWTLRPENPFLPVELRESDAITAQGNLNAEITAYLQTGIDGLFCDDPAAARKAVDLARK